jgi:hypothetical protein
MAGLLFLLLHQSVHLLSFHLAEPNRWQQAPAEKIYFQHLLHLL